MHGTEKAVSKCTLKALMNQWRNTEGVVTQPGGKLTRDRHSHDFRKKRQSSPVTVCSLSRKLQDEENDRG